MAFQIGKRCIERVLVIVGKSPLHWLESVVRRFRLWHIYTLRHNCCKGCFDHKCNPPKHLRFRKTLNISTQKNKSVRVVCELGRLKCLPSSSQQKLNYTCEYSTSAWGTMWNQCLENQMSLLLNASKMSGRDETGITHYVDSWMRASMNQRRWPTIRIVTTELLYTKLYDMLSYLGIKSFSKYIKQQI